MLRPTDTEIISAAYAESDNRSAELTHQQDYVQRDSLEWLYELLFFLVLAVASTWPLASRIESAIPKGQEAVSTVPLFNLWTIWWNADRAAGLFSGYWDAPIFAPAENAFALSQAQPVTAVVVPMVWMSESRSLAYNVYLLSVLAANGWCGSLLSDR